MVTMDEERMGKSVGIEGDINFRPWRGTRQVLYCTTTNMNMMKSSSLLEARPHPRQTWESERYGANATQPRATAASLRCAGNIVTSELVEWDHSSIHPETACRHLIFSYGSILMSDDEMKIPYIPRTCAHITVCTVLRYFGNGVESGAGFQYGVWCSGIMSLPWSHNGVLAASMTRNGKTESSFQVPWDRKTLEQLFRDRACPSHTFLLQE